MTSESTEPTDLPEAGATTRKCKNDECGQWYDARAASCYICGQESREDNYALKKAVETAQLNGALASQVSNARAEEAAGRMFRAARNSGRAHDAPLRGIVGYSDLVSGIKEQLKDAGV